jgi:integrase
MTAILVTYQGAPVALAGPRRTDLVGELPDLPPGDPRARFALRMAYYAQLVARGELPSPYGRSDGTVVFRTVRGKPLRAPSFFHYWDPVRRACGLDGMDFHELRHFCGAHLLNQLELPAHVVAHQLGHTDGGVLVMKLYGHPDEALAREQVKRAFGSSVAHLRAVREQSE